MLVKTTTTQNYFEIDNSFWQQHEGTPMGSPISSMLAEIFLQHLQEAHYPNFIKNRHIKYINQYVDDIFIIYDSPHATAEQIMDDHNKMHKNKKYTLEKEANQTLNYLDLKLHKQRGKITIGIHHNLPKLTLQYIIGQTILQNKRAAYEYNYMIHRINALRITQVPKSEEYNRIKAIARNNRYRYPTANYM
jgi:hypothetical protein